jgi:hypothetical protein
VADVVVLDEEAKAHLWRIMHGEIPPDCRDEHNPPCDICDRLRAALDSLPVEERVEYRVVGDGGPTLFYREGDLTRAKANADYRRERGHDGVCVQSRTVTESPWTDLPSEEGEGWMSEVRATEQAQDLAGNGGSFDALGVRPDLSLSARTTDVLIVHSGPDLSEEHRCPSCGECYPYPGTCWGRYGGADHPASRTERLV